jgi:hypothetical protein
MILECRRIALWRIAKVSRKKQNKGLKTIRKDKLNENMKNFC